MQIRYLKIQQQRKQVLIQFWEYFYSNIAISLKKENAMTELYVTEKFPFMLTCLK